MQSRKIFSLFLILSLLAEVAGGQNYYSFQDLSAIDESSLKDELNRLCQHALRSEMGEIDVRNIVLTKWLELGLNTTVDDAVDQAIDGVKRDTPYLDRFLSGWDQDAAEALAKTATRRAFSSNTFQREIEKLAASVSDALTEEFERASQETATSALLAVEEFLGFQYSEALKPIFREEISKAARVAGELDGITPTGVAGSMLDRHRKMATGVAVIVGAQIARMIGQQILKSVGRKIAGKVARKVAGRIMTGFIPVAGWIVGGLLIAWDLISGADGALPEIRKGLKKGHVKSLIRTGIADEISNQLSNEAPAISRRIALEVFSMWQDFKEKFATVLELTRESSDFKNLVDSASKEDLYKLSKLTDITLRSIGKEALIDAVERGLFTRAMNLPESAFAILKAAKSIDTMLDWATVAGSSIEGVVEFEIYKHKSPGDFDRGRLVQLLSIDDRKAISKLILLDNDRLASVLQISAYHLARLGQHLTASDFKQLAWYVEQGDDEVLNAVTTGLVEDPSLREKLGDERFTELLLASPDKAVFVDFIRSSDSYAGMWGHAMALLQGDLSTGAFLYKYSTGMVVGLLVPFLILALLLLAAAAFLFRRLRALVWPR